MRSGWRLGGSGVWLAFRCARRCTTWAFGVGTSMASQRPTARQLLPLGRGQWAANVFGMAIIGVLGALVAGGLFGLAWPWRVLGVVAVVPFALMVVVF